MEFMGTKQASENWGYSKGYISQWCRDGLIKDAEQDKKGSPWRIPINAQCPKPIKSKR